VNINNITRYIVSPFINFTLPGPKLSYCLTQVTLPLLTPPPSPQLESNKNLFNKRNTLLSQEKTVVVHKQSGTLGFKVQYFYAPSQTNLAVSTLICLDF